MIQILRTAFSFLLLGICLQVAAHSSHSATSTPGSSTEKHPRQQVVRSQPLPLPPLRMEPLPEDTCDRIFMRNGEIMQVRVKKVTETEVVFYKSCGQSRQEEFFISKSEALKVEFANGITLAFDKSGDAPLVMNAPPSRDLANAKTLSTLALIFALVSIPACLILIGPTLAIAGLVFGILGLYFTRKPGVPSRYRGYALAGLIISVIVMVFGVILIFAILGLIF